MKRTGSMNFATILAIALAAQTAPAAAQSDTRLPYQLEEQDLGAALRAIGLAANQQIMFEAAVVEGKRAPRLSGAYTPMEAVKAALRGTDLIASLHSNSIVVSRRFHESPSLTDSDASPASGAKSDIVVTGTRIRGAVSTSPVTTVSREDLERSGKTDMGQVIRELPQNYSGGQNPTIAGGGQGGFTNVSGSSTLNLRGLGPDATLTLINGHRVAFDAISQGVDISAIPIGAIERVEIVTDGASALYGSDAVGGVANVILRRDMDGAITSAGLSAATDGGGISQNYSLAAGSTWRGGGALLAGEHQHASEITAEDRSYATGLPANATLIPRQRQTSVIIAGHQSVAENVTLELDGHYMQRKSSRCTILSGNTGVSCYRAGSVVDSDIESWSLSPVLHFALPAKWEARLSGTFSESDTSIVTRVLRDGLETSVSRPNYDNTFKSIELGFEGPLLELPGGAARLAIGAGYRSASLSVDSRRYIAGVETPLSLYSEKRDVSFGYAEVFAPLVSAENAVPGIARLQFLAALRYEDHHQIDRLVTPKTGAVYSPINGVELKANWGKSFKSPTLNQTGQTSSANLLPGSLFVPAPVNGHPVLYLYGGSDTLKPERATTMTMSATIRPAFAEGLTLDASYFHIQYRDRVTSIFSPITAALQSTFSDFVELNPSADRVLVAIASTTGAFSNYLGGAFDPAAVAALVDDRLRNVSEETIKGVDGAIGYKRDLGGAGALSLKGSVTYLDSRRRITPRQDPITLAGNIFRPPHWRGRFAATWSRGNVTLTGIGSHVGRTTDNRFAPFVKVGAFTTFDLIAQARSGAEHGLFANIDARLSFQNLFNEKPASIRSTDSSSFPFDSINQTVWGRVIGLTLTKVW